MKVRAIKSKPTKKCPMDNCWEQIPEHHSFCPACTSWWHRIQMKDTRELSSYMQRMGRFSGRFNTLRTKSGGRVLRFGKRKTA